MPAAAQNLWRQQRMLPPRSLNQRRWATLLRCLFVINIFMVPVDICFYHSALGVSLPLLSSVHSCLLLTADLVAKLHARAAATAAPLLLSAPPPPPPPLFVYMVRFSLYKAHLSSTIVQSAIIQNIHLSDSYGILVMLLTLATGLATGLAHDP